VDLQIISERLHYREEAGVVTKESRRCRGEGEREREGVHMSKVFSSLKEGTRTNEEYE